MDANALQRVIQEALSVKHAVAEANKKLAEDPELVKARDRAHGQRVQLEWLVKTIREKVQSRTHRIELIDARIDDANAKLLAKELSAQTAALAAENIVPDSSERSEEAPSAHLDKLLNESDKDSEDEGYEELANVRWPGDPREPVAPSETSDSDSVRSYRFTPRAEREPEDEEETTQFRKLTAVHAAPTALQLRDADPRTGCTHLDLSRNMFGGKGMAYLTGWLKAGGALHSLLLADNPGLGDAGAALLGRCAYHAPHLHTLGLQRCNVSEMGMRHLASGIGKQTPSGAPCPLRHLWLLGNAARDDGARHLAAALLADGCALHELGLEENRVGAAGGAALAHALYAPSKERNPVDGLMKPGRQCQLRTLRLMNNPLGEPGVTALGVALESNRNLRTLQLRGCGGGDAGGLALAKALETNTALLHLGLENNGLTLLCTRALRKAMLPSALKMLALDLSQGGRFGRPRDTADLLARAAPPPPAPPKRGGQRRREAQEAALAAAKRQTWNEVLAAVGAMDEPTPRKGKGRRKGAKPASGQEPKLRRKLSSPLARRKLRREEQPLDLVKIGEQRTMSLL